MTGNYSFKGMKHLLFKFRLNVLIMQILVMRLIEKLFILSQILRFSIFSQFRRIFHLFSNIIMSRLYFPHLISLFLLLLQLLIFLLLNLLNIFKQMRQLLHRPPPPLHHLLRTHRLPPLLLLLLLLLVILIYK